MIVSKRMKDLGIFMSGLTYSPTDLSNKDEGILVLRSSNIQNGKLVYADNVYVNCHLDTNQMVKENDVLICSRNGSARLVGKTAIIPYGLKATWGAFMMLFRPYKKNSNYLNYVFSSQIEKYKGMFSTSTINQLTNSMLGNMFIDYEEDGNVQQRIVTYLDTKLSEIDTQMSILTSKRDAYLRLKKSIINHAVTHGLNPNVKMKDSGIEWIGEVPEHWRRMRLKDIAYLYSGLTGKSGDDFRCDNTNITKPYVPFTSILNNFKINSTDFPRVIMSDNETQNQVIVNDLLFLMSSEDYDSIAKSAVVNENLGEVYLNSFCRGLRFTSKDIFANFVNYQIQATNYRDALRFEARGFTRINIKIEKISSMFVCLPPLPEQRAIATYLDDKCAKIDTIVSNLDKQISRYADLKRSLIDEVITGKRAV